VISIAAAVVGGIACLLVGALAGIAARLPRRPAELTANDVIAAYKRGRAEENAHLLRPRERTQELPTLPDDDGRPT
jgi:hypothetical protein